MSKARRAASSEAGRRAAAPASAPRRKRTSIAVLSQSAYARHRRISRQAVRKAISEGRIPVRADRRIDVAAADKAWNANTDPTRGGTATAQTGRLPVSQAEPSPPEPAGGSAAAAVGGPVELASAQTSPLSDIDVEDLSLNDVRKHHEFLKAQLAEIELSVRRGELAPVAEIQDAEFKLARTVRDQLLTLPDNLCDQLAGVAGNAGSAAEIRRVLFAAINAICRELSIQLAETEPEERAS